MGFILHKRLASDDFECIALSSIVLLLFTGMCRGATSNPEPKDIGQARLEGLAFLTSYRPQRDANLSLLFLQRNVDLALEARLATTWAKTVPWHLFLNDVLPYARYVSPSQFYVSLLGRLVLVVDASALWTPEMLPWHSSGALGQGLPSLVRVGRTVGSCEMTCREPC